MESGFGAELPVLEENGQNFSQVQDVAGGRVVFQGEEKTVFFQFAVKLLLFFFFALIFMQTSKCNNNK